MIKYYIYNHFYAFDFFKKFIMKPKTFLRIIPLFMESSETRKKNVCWIQLVYLRTHQN